jgi:two-component system sensor kinase FixL
MGQEIIGKRDASNRAGCQQSDSSGDLFDELRARSRLADVGARTIALGHELRQPLFAISLANENLRLMLESPDTPRHLMQRAVERTAEQVQRAQALIDMALKSQADAPPVPETTDLVLAMRNACRFLDDMFDRAGILIEPLHADLSARVRMSRIEAEQIFVNVLRNAIDSIQSRRKQGWSGAGRIVIEFEMDRTIVRCLITDNGAGLSEGVAQTGFRPLYTTKAAEGTGIGLFICEQILSIAGGSIRLRPGASQGAQVEVRLPLRPEG